MRITVLSLFVLTIELVVGCNAVRQTASRQKDSGVPAQTRKVFAEHPGTVAVHYDWNHSTQILNAATLPESRRFVYRSRDDHEVSNANGACYRVPIVEENVLSFDSKGKAVEPKYATFFSITQYGPGHHYLRETQANAPLPPLRR